VHRPATPTGSASDVAPVHIDYDGETPHYTIWCDRCNGQACYACGVACLCP
jgi:hypothetical protein